MRRFFAIVLTSALLLNVGLYVQEGYAASFGSLISQAMQALKVSKDDPDLLILTNAPYAREGGGDALNLLDQAQNLSGCTVGKGNLLFFQRPQTYPLRLMLFNKKDGHAVVVCKEKNKWECDDLNLSPDVVSKSAFWKKARTYHAGRDMFTLATMANVWAKGGPYDFLKCAELHNHICPGLTSGYLMAHYILNHFPLNPGESYTVISCPVWCKEDALQVILDCTPGKRGMVVKRLSAEQKKRISITNPAGMVLIWDAKQKKGRGVALSFSFDPLKALVPKDAPKAAMVISSIGFLNQPDRFVSTGAEFSLDETRYNAIIQAGTNPWAVVGLVK